MISVMGRLIVALIGLLLGTAAADTERVLFTTRTTLEAPVGASDPVASKEYGFESVTLRNISAQDIEAVELKVVMVTAESLEQEVDGGRIHVSLEAGTSKKVDVYLGQIKALQQKAHSMRLDPAVTVLTVASTDFADGTIWYATEGGATIDSPPDAPLRKGK
jgi:hypothetical protein